MDEVVRHAEDFLYKIITDNTISYPNDRNANEWTFLYYVNNAYYRMELIQTALPGPWTHDAKKVANNRPTVLWDHAHNALKEMVEKFGKLLDSAA